MIKKYYSLLIGDDRKRKPTIVGGHISVQERLRNVKVWGFVIVWGQYLDMGSWVGS